MHELEKAEETQSYDLMLVAHGNIGQQDALEVPFGYYVERDADLLILHRPDSSFVAAFSARGVDPFEVELTVWEDAD